MAQVYTKKYKAGDDLKRASKGKRINVKKAIDTAIKSNTSTLRGGAKKPTVKEYGAHLKLMGTAAKNVAKRAWGDYTGVIGKYQKPVADLGRRIDSKLRPKRKATPKKTEAKMTPTTTPSQRATIDDRRRYLNEIKEARQKEFERKHQEELKKNPPKKKPK